MPVLYCEFRLRSKIPCCLRITETNMVGQKHTGSNAIDAGLYRRPRPAGWRARARRIRKWMVCMCSAPPISRIDGEIFPFPVPRFSKHSLKHVNTQITTIQKGKGLIFAAIDWALLLSSTAVEGDWIGVLSRCLIWQCSGHSNGEAIYTG